MLVKLKIEFLEKELKCVGGRSPTKHGLRTPNEGMNQRYLKKWADAMWQTKYASAVPKNLGVGVDFRPFSEDDFLTGRP